MTAAKKKAAPSARGKTFEYSALQFAQRSSTAAPKFLVFHSTAADVMEWADVDRLGPDNTSGAQRPLRGLKVGKVARYFDKDKRNTIPTSVVIALDQAAVKYDGKADPFGEEGALRGNLKITVQRSQKPGLIIDGQHRVFGAAKYRASLRLNVVAFLGGDEAERAFQFVVINNSASKVSKDHVKALNLQYDKDKLNRRLINSAGVALGLSEAKFDDLALLDGTEPFKGLIEWETNPNGFIAANALESALGEVKDRASLLGIDGLERDVFLKIWSKVYELRADLWVPSKTVRLLHKASIHALTKFVLESMLALQRTNDEPVDFTDEDTLDKVTSKAISRIPPEFWTSEWTLKELDTASGRQKVYEALEVIDGNVRFKRPWYSTVALIDPALLHGQTYEKPKKKVAKR